MRRCTAHTVAAVAAVFIVLVCMPSTAGAHATAHQHRVPAHAASTPSPRLSPLSTAPPQHIGAQLAAAAEPPMEALKPVSGLQFGDGLDAGPVLAGFDVAALLALAYVVRRRWLSPPV